MSNFVVIRRLGYLLLTIFITRTQAPLPSPCLHDQPFDFEPAVPGQESCFQPMPSTSGSASLSTDRWTVKHGTRSLKWIASGASKLRLQSSTFTIPSGWLRNGGVKVWIYKVSSSGHNLEVEFKQTSTTTIVAKFRADLNFAGWRGIWVKFEECKVKRSSLTRPTVIDEVNFVLSGADTIYIDALKFEESLARQSRDKIVPPISPFGLNIYDKSNTFQQTYRWSLKTIPPSPLRIDPDKKKSLRHIKSRLKNYYCDERKWTSTFPRGSFLKERWNSLLKGVDKAHQDYDTTLTFLGGRLAGRIIGPPLSCRNCKLGKKFGDIFEKILLPLALEYHIRSRTDEVIDAATTQLSKLNSGIPSRVQKAKIAIAGRDSNMQGFFTGHLPPTGSFTQAQVESAINDLNLDRLKKIKNLLDFVKEQGFADGSGLGSLDHEMNIDGAGFMHTLFLVSDHLSKSRLLDLIDTAKWYNDFGEIYQSPTFEFKGTTADRMITLMLFRLIIVLVMPSSTNAEIKARIRDMDALVRWMDNALSVNEGLAGVIKPDFTGFHHKAIYGSAYVPQALHTAAFVQYLLGGTAFALSPSSTETIRRGLEMLRIIAVKYSTPASINGRFPQYNNKALIKAVLPAYAYISVSYPPSSTLPSAIPRGITVTTLNRAQTEMFLRLYDDRSVDSYRGNGRPNKGKYYFNSLGSLDIMEAVKSTARSSAISAEPSLEGHWSKNFAALSVHRRKNWAVTVKGFNRFVWDFEGSDNENVYGLFSSHGALLIANSEADLEVHDVENGWDWAKIPGTTTIDMGNPTINNDLIIGTGRFYNKRKLAGSLTFEGTMGLKNGVFGMDFRQPNYGFGSRDWRRRIIFGFKKSVFSFENLLVCLGSNIEARRIGSRVAQTTLFQDKLVPSSFIKVDGVQKFSSASYRHTPSRSTSHTTLTDAKGNFYYIPDPSKSILHVTVGSQTSKSDDGKSNTSGIYGTTWFEHSPSNPSYQYAVLIPTTSYHAPLTGLATAQETAGSEVYEVLQRDSHAHVVQFRKSPRTWSALSSPITGYVIFRVTSSLPSGGPVAAVSSGDCLIMVEETAGFIYLSVSYPDLNFGLTGAAPTNSDDVGEKLLYKSTSGVRSVTVTLRKAVTAMATPHVHGTPVGYAPIVQIRGSGRNIRFRNLKNGFSVEVKLTK